MIDLIIWWIGATVVFVAIGAVAAIIWMLLRHAWNTTKFVAALWRMTKKAGAKPEWERVPRVWWENFVSPPDNTQWVDPKGISHIVYWPTRVTKKEDAGW